MCVRQPLDHVMFCDMCQSEQLCIAVYGKVGATRHRDVSSKSHLGESAVKATLMSRQIEVRRTIRFNF